MFFSGVSSRFVNGNEACKRMPTVEKLESGIRVQGESDCVESLSDHVTLPTSLCPVKAG